MGFTKVDLIATIIKEIGPIWEHHSLSEIDVEVLLSESITFRALVYNRARQMLYGMIEDQIALIDAYHYDPSDIVNPPAEEEHIDQYWISVSVNLLEVAERVKQELLT